MWDRQCVGLNRLVIKKEEVEINFTRRPFFYFWRSFPADVQFNFLETLQQIERVNSVSISITP